MKRVLNWLLIVSLVIILGVGIWFYYSYKKSHDADTSLLELNASIYQNPLQLKEGRVDECGINIIFYTSEDQKELKEVVIEILQSGTGELTYIDIPTNTEIFIGSRLYQKLAVINPEMPQYFKLEKLAQMFDDEKRYAYGQMILDDMLTIDSSYYTVIGGESDTFKEYRKLKSRQYGTLDEETIRDMIEKEYPQMSSNLSKKKKLKYAQVYAAVGADSVTEEAIEGTEHTDSFEIDLINFLVKMRGLTALE